MQHTHASPSQTPQRGESSRSFGYKPALAWFATASAGWVFVLVTLGAFTTSIGAGMAFSDWPLSNGSINPEGWLAEIDKFAEHSHRLSGSTMGILTLVLAVWLWRVEARAWLRRLGWSALAIVVVQGLIGGSRVRLDPIHVTGFDMTLGQMLRIPHGILAQIFVCILFAIAASLSRGWFVQAPHMTNRATLNWARMATALLFVQLTVAAMMRHNHAGLAIPTFPLVNGGILGVIPTHWDFRIALNFAHRTLALAITVTLVVLALSLWRERTAQVHLKITAALMIALLAVQITLGALSIWTLRNPTYTTTHVVCGASLLATTFTLTWWLHRSLFNANAAVQVAALSQVSNTRRIVSQLS